MAIDGTKVHANASHHCNLDYEQLAREILKEAGEIDACEDELYGEARGDELPEHLRTHEGRRAALREAKEKLARERADREDAKVKATEGVDCFGASHQPGRGCHTCGGPEREDVSDARA